MENTANIVNSDLIRGNVDTIILKCLQLGELYGVQICNLVKQASNGTYVLKQPTLYSAVKRLEKQKLITSYWKDNPKGGRLHIYGLTESGRNYLVNKKDDWKYSKGVIDTILSDIDDTLTTPTELEKNLETANINLQELDRGRKIRHENAVGNVIVTTEGVFAGEVAASTLVAAREVPVDFTSYTKTDNDVFTVPLVSTQQQQINDLKPYICSDAPRSTARTDTPPLLKYLSDEDIANLSSHQPVSMDLFKKPESTQQVAIRPFTKQSDFKTGSFILYNKLRLVCASIVFAILAVGLGLSNAFMKPSLESAEQTFMIFCWIIPAFYFVFHVAFYTVYPKLKKKIPNQKWDFVRRAGLVAATGIAAISVNLIAGLSDINAIDYLVYWAVPCILSSAFFIEGLAIWGLKRNAFFTQ